MKFRTEITIPPSAYPLGYGKPIVMLGSCFTDYVGSLLEKYLFDVTLNPFGVIYNPLSISNSIVALLDRKGYGTDDLQQYNGLWFSFDHYTKFSHPDPDTALEKINRQFLTAREKLAAAGHLLVTFGTAFVYEQRESGRVVNNCHKIPASHFSRRMLTVQEIVEETGSWIGRLLERSPGMHIILTVSPVRHLRDGFSENQHSKASLLLATRELVGRYPGSCSYFPSYEIMMDDLRDYRFYNSDMVHPNDQAIGYIWERFKESRISESARQVIAGIEPLLKMTAHRPQHTGSETFRAFESRRQELLGKLKKDFPFLQWQNFR